jgi:hypothetical protein
VNEDLRETQSQVLWTIGEIHIHYNDIVEMQDQVNEHRIWYSEFYYAFDKVAYWKERHTQALEGLPRYDAKQHMMN